MHAEEFAQVLKQYISTHQEDWLGLHDSHFRSFGEKIIQSGLSVSYNPYGSKVRQFHDKNGKIDLSRNFMATMYHLNSPNFELYSVPVEPVIIRIPARILNELNLSPQIEQSYQSVCGYGKMEILQSQSEDFVRPVRIVEPRKTQDDANIRLLPAYFVVGYFDMQSEKFIENTKYFDNLPESEQQKIIEKLKEFHKIQQENSNRQSQPE